MSSGAGMTDGLLRKAGTGPDRLMLPAGETPKGKLVIKAFFFLIILFFVSVWLIRCSFLHSSRS